MNTFHTVAIPHNDILQGRLTIDIFAADLWDVYHNQGPEEYRNAETFFNKTYFTEGLKDLLNVIEKRVVGTGGDPVIQLQTPFGGGKTHSLIAMYHKAREWNAKCVVMVGEKMKTGSNAQQFDTLWGLMEKQLTGKIKNFNSPVPPGGDQIKELLEKNSPALILIDELIPYLNVADAVSVEKSTLTTLTLTFIQNLSNVISSVNNVSLVFTTTPSNPYNHTQRGEDIVLQLQNITGRREIIKTPVQENEITKVIRRRLFSDLKEKEIKKIVSEFMTYIENEGLLPPGIEPSEYRNRFIDAYPFMPDVIDILYHRWGSFTSFQRTRGVLRLLALVVYALKETNIPYISLADFSLKNQEIRQELLKHIGPEFNAVIAADISDFDAGAKKVDTSLGNAYQGLNLGTRSATAIFMYSFSGGSEQGVTASEIKRSATTVSNPSSVIAEAIDQLRSKLFYLQNISEKYFFRNQPNLNRIVLTKMDNIKSEKLIALEQELLRGSIKGGCFKVFIWEENSANVYDSEDLKLIIMAKKNKDTISDILKNKGKMPRVYRNIVFFLYPLESERAVFVSSLKKQIAYELIEQDTNLSLTPDQKKEVKTELQKAKKEIKESLRRLYRIIAVPDKDELIEIDLGIPTYGENLELDREAYNKLRSEGKILERIAPLVIREKFLTGKQYVLTEQLYQSFIKTPGSTRIINQNVIIDGIEEGVKTGLFGLGELNGDEVICRYFKQTATVSLSGNEIIISEPIAKEQKKKQELSSQESHEESSNNDEHTENEYTEVSDTDDDDNNEDDTLQKTELKKNVRLKFNVPRGQVANVMGVMNLLQSKFNSLEIKITALNGSITQQDYEDKIIETFHQLDIDFEEE